MTKRIFLDYASGTPLDPRVFEVMVPYLTEFTANPSSLYQGGKTARDAIEQARSQVAMSIHARPDEVVFTSGGTEANNLAIIGAALARESMSKMIVTSPIEHQSVLRTCQQLEGRGWKLCLLPVDSMGIVSGELPDTIHESLALASVMLVNNEVGTIQPIHALGKQIHRLNGIFHTDACQALGHIPLDINSLGVDLLTINSGKVYGPKGAGALYIRKDTQVQPLSWGGMQEWGLRPGTENVPAIVGFGKACELAIAEMMAENDRFLQLRDMVLAALAKISGVTINGSLENRVVHNINVSFSGIEPEALLFYLDNAGIEVSSGSACTQATMSASHVLLAMGIDSTLAQSSLRITFGRMTTVEDVATLVAVLPGIVAKLRG